MALAVVGAVTSVPAIANETAPPADTIAQIQQGRALYVRHCAQCHGINMVTPGTVAFDLRQVGRRRAEAIVAGLKQQEPHPVMPLAVPQLIHRESA